MRHADWVAFGVGGFICLLIIVAAGFPPPGDPQWRKWRQAARKRLRRH